MVDLGVRFRRMWLVSGAGPRFDLGARFRTVNVSLSKKQMRQNTGERSLLEFLARGEFCRQCTTTLLSHRICPAMDNVSFLILTTWINQKDRNVVENKQQEVL